jgi:hypothetical protein
MQDYGYLKQMANELGRHAEMSKIDGAYTASGQLMLDASHAIRGMILHSDSLLDKLISIEHIVAQALRNE